MKNIGEGLVNQKEEKKKIFLEEIKIMASWQWLTYLKNKTYIQRKRKIYQAIEIKNAIPNWI